MDQSRTFLRNVTSLTAANLVSHIGSAVISILVINHLGDEGYGSFKAAMAFATVFLIFAETGVGARFLYDRSGDKSLISEHFGAAILLHAGPYLIVFGVTMVATLFFDYPPLVVKIIAVVAWAAIFRTFGEVCDKVIAVYQHLHLNALLRSLRFLGMAVGGILVVTLDLGPLAWAFVSLAAMFIYAAATFAASLRYARPRFLLTMVWPTLAASYVFGIGAIFYAIYENVDQVLLYNLLPHDIRDAQVGIYGAAYTLIMFTYTIPSAFVASMEPVVFAARQDAPRLARLGSLSSRILGLLALPLAAGTIILAPRIRALVLPNINPFAATALSVLSLLCLMRFFNFPAGMLMAAAGLQLRRVFIQAGAVALNIGVNLIVIPKFGILGAAWTTVLTELFLLALYEWSLVRALPGYGEFQRLLKPLMATLVMSGFVLASLYVFDRTIRMERFAWIGVVPFAAAALLLAAPRAQGVQ